MNELPSPDVLAKLVSAVTNTMFGMSFSLSEPLSGTPWTTSPAWHTAVLPIGGARPLTIAVSSDHAGAQALCCAMFSCPVEELDPSMIDDSMSELVNIVAGQLKRLLGVDHALGLPRMLNASGEAVAHEGWRSATMRSASTEVRFWVAVGE